MSRLRVLAYHRIAELGNAPGLNPRLISATPGTFARQMDHLARHYRVVAMEDVLEAIRNRRPLPGRATLLTFDDAYFDFRDHAWPILQRHHFPATVFVPTAFPEDPRRLFWWDRLFRSMVLSSQEGVLSSPIGLLSLATPKDRLQSLRKLQAHLKTVPHYDAMKIVGEIDGEQAVSQNGQRSTMTWEEMRHLAKGGLTVAAHTRTHPIMTQLPAEQAREEIRCSMEDVKREIGTVLPIFCYPNGSSNGQLKEILQQLGIEVAFGLGNGYNNLRGADLMELRRIPITRRTTPFIFRLRLLRLFSCADRWRSRRKC